MEIKQAERSSSRLRIGLQGPSGSGKTYSALLLAYGITNNWSKIVVIDTENGSANLYANLGPYKVLRLDQPYSPERYIEAMALAEHALSAVSSDNLTASTAHSANPPSVIIIDSVSHEWEGPGGVLDVHGSMPGNSFTNWNKLTPRHNAFISKLLSSTCHIICSIRSKQDYVLVEKNGKMIPEKVGLKAVTREGLDYELTLVFELDIKNFATASKDRTGLFFGKPEIKINSNTGRSLLNWASATVTNREVIEQIQKSQSLEELIGIYNTYPTLREELIQEFTARKNALTTKTT